MQGYTSASESSEHYSKARECHPSAARGCAILSKLYLCWLHCKLSYEVKTKEEEEKKKEKEKDEDLSAYDMQAWVSILFVV